MHDWLTGFPAGCLASRHCWAVAGQGWVCRSLSGQPSLLGCLGAGLGLLLTVWPVVTSGTAVWKKGVASGPARLSRQTAKHLAAHRMMQGQRRLRGLRQLRGLRWLRQLQHLRTAVQTALLIGCTTPCGAESIS